MAKNRSEPKKSVAAAEEESSTDNEGSESDSGSEPEPEKTQTQMQMIESPSEAATNVTEASSTPAKIQATSSSSYETDSESDSESESQKPAPIIKPTDDPLESAQTKPRKSDADREVTESKRQKLNPEEISEIKASADESKKQLFQRLWSEDDEIALLEGMIEYTEKENGDPYTDLDAFHDFIRKSLHFTVSKKQVQNKMKRLRKKYINNAGKGKKSFSKPHEQKTYEVSRKVWGKGDEKMEDNNQVTVVHALMAYNGSAKINKNSMKKAPVVEDAIETPVAAAAAASSGWKNSLSKNKGAIVIGEEKRREIEKKRKAVVVTEINLFLTELELIQEQVKATLGAILSGVFCTFSPTTIVAVAELIHDF